MELLCAAAIVVVGICLYHLVIVHVLDDWKIAKEREWHRKMRERYGLNDHEGDPPD